MISIFWLNSFISKVVLSNSLSRITNMSTFHNIKLMSYKSLILAAVLLVLAVDCREKLRFLNKHPSAGSPVPVPDYNQTQLWFDQVLDHYDYTATKTWRQRYWVVDKFFNKTTGPVFLFICGEYICPGVPKAREWIILLAQKYSGLILVLEHRYYGESMPYGNDSLNFDKMKLLNTEQALKDLAYFIMTVEAKQLHSVSKNPWITVGGSYPGAMSAWFRYKYPHLTIGSIASSAVVKAIEDFKEFDEQIYLSSERSGSHCVDAIRNLSDYVEKQVTGVNATSFMAQFKAEKLSAREFLFYWSDVTVELIQYGSRTKLCDGLKNKTFDQQFNYVKALALESDPSDYGSYYLSNATFAMENKGGARAWIFQSCTEFGWLQTFSDKHPMRSKLLTIEFYRKWCEDSFGLGVLPYVDRSNNEFGGFNESSTELIMVNGIEDPWIWAGIQKSQGKIIAEVADCPDCAHCVDLYTPTTTDSSKLTAIRNKEELQIKTWIETYWKNHKNVAEVPSKKGYRWPLNLLFETD